MWKEDLVRRLRRDAVYPFRCQRAVDFVRQQLHVPVHGSGEEENQGGFLGKLLNLRQEELACRLMELLLQYYPSTLEERYRVTAPAGTPGYELLEMAGRNRGFLLARGEIHTERMAKVLLDEFRSGKLGKFTLEQPKEETI